MCLTAGLKGFSRPIGKSITAYHSENVLLVVITDERSHIRKFELKSWRQYHTCLQHNSNILSLPLDATEYHDMDDWQILAATKPPVTIYVTDNELKDIIPAQIS